MRFISNAREHTNRTLLHLFLQSIMFGIGIFTSLCTAVFIFFRLLRLRNGGGKGVLSRGFTSLLSNFISTGLVCAATVLAWLSVPAFANVWFTFVIAPDSSFFLTPNTPTPYDKSCGTTMANTGAGAICAVISSSLSFLSLMLDLGSHCLCKTSVSISKGSSSSIETVEPSSSVQAISNPLQLDSSKIGLTEKEEERVQTA